VDPEAQRAKALVEHPVRGCAEHTDPIRREALCRAAQSLDDDVGGCLWRSANGRTDVSVLIGPTYRRNLVAIEQREARAGAGEELVHGGTVQSERRWLESTPCAARLVAGESYDSWIIALSLLSACSDKWSLGRAQGLALPIPDAAVLFVVVVGVALVPVSINGWGLRELAVVAILGRHGVAPEQALVFSVCFGLVLAVGSLPGALAWLVYSFVPAKRSIECSR